MTEEVTAIIPYSLQYKEQVVFLLKNMWKSLDETQRRERFEWRYEKNPYHSEPFIYVALDNNKVAAFRGFVLQHFIQNGKTYKVFSPADAIVHPDYRRMGLFSKLTIRCLEDIHAQFPDNSLVLNLSSNHLSTPGYLKKGWQATNGLKNYAYRISFKKFVSSKFSRSSPDSVDPQARISKKGYLLEISNKLNSKEFSSIAEKTREPQKLSNVRDQAYFNWRYSYQPELYTYVSCWQGEYLAGFAVIENISSAQSRLCEYCAPDYHILQLILDFAIKYLSIPIMRTYALSGMDKKLLAKCGFVNEPSMLLNIIKKQRLPVLVRPTRPEPEDQDFLINGSDIRDINKWQICLADKH